MDSASQIFDVGELDFDSQVLERSLETPVLVDFWAPWCGPCRALGPVLEAMAEAAQGRFLLAKLNTDENPSLAQRYQIRGIPAVKLFRDGRVAAEFVGALPPPEIRAFLDEHIPDAASAAAKQAQALILTRELDAANAALAAAPSSNAPMVLATRARLALLRGRLDEARAAAHAVPATADEREIADAVLEAVTFAEEGRAATTPSPNVEGRYLAAGAALAAGRIEPALDGLLEVVRESRKFRDDAGRKMILALFQILGVRSDTSDDYRRKLATLL